MLARSEKVLCKEPKTLSFGMVDKCSDYLHCECCHVHRSCHLPCWQDSKHNVSMCTKVRWNNLDWLTMFGIIMHIEPSMKSRGSIGCTRTITSSITLFYQVQQMLCLFGSTVLHMFSPFSWLVGCWSLTGLQCFWLSKVYIWLIWISIFLSL